MVFNLKLQISELEWRRSKPTSGLCRFATTKGLNTSGMRRAFEIVQLLLLFCVGSFGYAAAASKPPAAQRLLDRTPFDRVTLNAANGGTVLDVLPVELPQRPLEAIPNSGSLRVRLLDKPTEEYEIAWGSIANVRVFEQLLLDEAERLTTAQKYDEAYDYYSRLDAEFPSLGKLKTSICNFLQLNAVALSQANQNDRALALLMTLYRRDPAYATLPAAVEKVAGEVIQSYLRQADYAAARRVLELWQNQFQNIAPQAAAAWQSRFQAAAAKQAAEANDFIAKKQYIPARKSVGRALAIWPSLESAKQAMVQINREFPYVTVGVLEPSPSKPERRIDDWAALRASALTQRLLAEEYDFGADGGVYRSPFGEWHLDESGRLLTLSMSEKAGVAGGSAASPDEIARFILSAATPDTPNYQSGIASLVDNVALSGGDSVVLHLKRVHVRPESVLRLPPALADTTRNDVGSGPFVLADIARDQVVFATSTSPPATSGPRAVVEQSQPSDDAAVAALINGDIDVLDRVPPWHLARLRAVKDIRVESYKLPTVHVLIPNMSRPLLAKREFRRALCYGIDRKWIVDRAILGGVTIPGFEPVSGPFPAGTSLSDPIRYGYNNRVQLRSFEPRLASILATVAWSAVRNPPESKNGKQSEKQVMAKPTDENLPELVLAYPRDSMARVACQSIRAQLVREGIPISLHEFTADELIAGKIDCDLRYAELAMNEPLNDVGRLFGPQGIVGRSDNPILTAALRKLDTATNWKDVRSGLAEIHEIVDHDLPVIPLWQTVNYFAFRNSVRGVGETPVTLYQNIEQWSVASEENVASANSSLR
jgi:tetratricopeptide (TPR) repeat protein